MSFAALVAVCLCGQVNYSVEDSLNQWESHLLESQWALIDPESGDPRLLLVLKCYNPDHQTFELYEYGRWGDQPYATVRAWTGTYKMQSRENRNRSISEKLVHLDVEQQWWPVDGLKLDPIREPVVEDRLAPTPTPFDALPWHVRLYLLHWIEQRDFKPFIAELKVNVVTEGEPTSAEDLSFLLQSSDVKKIGWWVVGTECILSPVKKWRPSAAILE